MPRYYHDALLRHRQLEAYYHVLSEDPRLVADLELLVSMIPPDVPSTALFNLAGIDPAVQRAITNFVSRWLLPSSGADDVLHSLQQARYGAKLRLTGAGFGYASRETIGTIQPPSFDYDPARMSRAQVKEYADRVRKSIMAQADEIERCASAAGFHRIPANHSEWSQLARMARRLYLFAVVGETAESIADQDPDYRDAQVMYNTIYSWARVLGVPLPKRKPGPRKTATAS